MTTNKPAANSAATAQHARVAYGTLAAVRANSVSGHAAAICKLLGKSDTLARLEDSKRDAAVITAARVAERHLKALGGDAKPPAKGENLTTYNVMRNTLAKGKHDTAAAVLAAAIESMLAFNFERAEKAKAKREQRKALNDVINSRTATLAEQHAALNDRADIDATKVVEELNAAIERTYRAIVAGRAKGIGRARMLELIDQAYPVTEPATVA